MIPKYRVKWLAELGWTVFIAVVVVVLTALLDVENVTDWRAWSLGLAANIARVAAAVAINGIRKAFPTEAEVPLT